MSNNTVVLVLVLGIFLVALASNGNTFLAFLVFLLIAGIL